MRKLLLLLLAAIPIHSKAQYATFESLPLPTADTYYVNYTLPGKDVGFNDGGVHDGGVHFPCVYDTGFGLQFWFSGFAYSNMRDSVTSGYMNQYSAKPASGANGSNKYVVAYGEHNYISRISGFSGLTGFDIANTTYSYNSMKYGDAIGKKFGGASGNDSDWFKLTVRTYQRGVHGAQDSMEIYLADFRFSDNSKDYILKDWKHITTTFPGHGFAHADSITFTLSSSDTGRFGINTPLYFALDNVQYYAEGVAQVSFGDIARISPNPACDFLYVDLKNNAMKEAVVLDMAGRTVATIPIMAQRTVLNTSGLPAGRYIIQLNGDGLRSATSFIRQ